MNSALILAGGSGLRLKSETPKQFLLLNKKRILDYSINTFCNNKNVDEVVIVCHSDWLKKLKVILSFRCPLGRQILPPQ